MKNINKKKEKVTVILPTYNESETIQKLIREIKKLKNRYILEIIVIDANSTDKTVAISRKEKVKIIKRNKKYGKGADFWLASKKSTGKYVVQIDADGQFLPSEIPLLITKLQNGYDVAIGWRESHKGAPFIRTLGNRIFSPITTLLVGKVIYDVVAGFKAFKRPVLLSLDLKEPHFGYEGEIVVKTVRMGYKLAQVPISYRNRQGGKSQVSPFRDGPLTIWSLLKARFEKLPKKKIS